VETISPARSGGLCGSFASKSTRLRSAKSGLSRTSAPLPRWLSVPLQ
jgi:hypothetical protein